MMKQVFNVVVLVLCCACLHSIDSQERRSLQLVEYDSVHRNKSRPYNKLSRSERASLRSGRQRSGYNENLMEPTTAPTLSEHSLAKRRGKRRAVYNETFPTPTAAPTALDQPNLKPGHIKDSSTIWGNWSSIIEEERGLEFVGESRQRHSYLTLLQAYSFPLNQTGSCNYTIPDDTYCNLFLFTDIFISGTAINFVSVVYPDYVIDYYKMTFRVVEKQKVNLAKIRHVGKILRILDLTVNSDVHEQVVLGVVGSPKLKAYLEVTDSLVLEVSYGNQNMTFHLYRDSKKLQGLVPIDSISAFVLFDNEPEAQVFAWMDYYTKYIGIRHFVLYYNGIIAKSKNVKSMITRIDTELRMVALVEWTQPYKRFFNWTMSPVDGHYQRIALTTAMHSAYYRFKDSLSWIVFTEIGNYMLKNSVSLSLIDYLHTCTQNSIAVVVFNKTYAGYMFSHRHRPNVNDTNIDIFSKEVLIKGLTYIKEDTFRVKYAANTKGLKLLGIKNKFIFASPSYRKMEGDIESIRLVPQERFSKIYGSNTSCEKTSFELIHSNLTVNSDPSLMKINAKNESLGTVWSSILNATVSVISSALDHVDVTKT